MVLLTPKEVASRLKLSRSKVYDLISSGKLAALKIGGAVRIAEGDLLSFLESCRVCEKPRKASFSSSRRMVR